MAKKSKSKKGTGTKASAPSAQAPAETAMLRTKRALVREQQALAKLLDDKLEELHRLQRAGSQSWDRQWEVVGEILEHDPPLWRGRFTSEVKFIAKELPGEDRRSVNRNVLVAGAFRPEDIAARGVGVLEEIALFVQEKAGMLERPRALDLARIVVDVPDGREVRRVPASKVVIEEARAARRALGKRKPRKAEGPRALAVRKALGKRKALAKVSVTLDEDDATFARVPLDLLSQLGDVLAKLKLPERNA
ncbi:MAG: hypothetical protein K8H88_18825 [Sandaracinaceae bacterium]|nr:hypothetical protein [Sandaracinaceae bacterium]